MKTKTTKPAKTTPTTKCGKPQQREVKPERKTLKSGQTAFLSIDEDDAEQLRKKFREIAKEMSDCTDSPWIDNGIPRCTIRNWTYAHRTPPNWLMMLLIRLG